MSWIVVVYQLYDRNLAPRHQGTMGQRSTMTRSSGTKPEGLSLTLFCFSLHFFGIFPLLLLARPVWAFGGGGHR
jgi:hypothetical protein